MLFLLAILAVAGLTHGVDGARLGFSDKAPCRQEDLSKCGSEFVVYSNTTQLPLDAKVLQATCRSELKSADCTKKFTENCQKGVVRGVALVAMQNVIDELEGKCTVGSPKHASYLQHVPCLNKAGEAINRCAMSYIQDLTSIAEFTARKNKGPYTCCRHYRFEDCVRKAVNAKCSSAAAERYLDNILETTMGELVKLGCRRYPRQSEKCTKEFAQRKLRKAALKDDVNIFTPLIEIIAVFLSSSPTATQ